MHGPILYLVSKLPSVTETFVVNEWLQLSARSRMEIGALRHTGEPVVHPETAAVLRQAHFVPALAPTTLLANASLLGRRPRLYLQTLARVLQGSRGRPGGGVLKGIVVFQKAVRLAVLVERLGIVHVHAHFLNHPATAAWIINRLTGRPFSVTAHANDLFVGPALLEEKVGEASFVVAISEYNRTYLRQLVPTAGRIEVVRCGVDVDTFAFGERVAGHRLVCVAALQTKKGHSDLLHVVAALVDEFPDLSLRLVGDGPERKRLERESESLGLTERIQFSGALPSPAVRAALADANVFVLPSRPQRSSRMDGIPVSLMEAMASGVPVVSTRISGIPELVIDEETGLLVPPADRGELSAAIRRLLTDRDLGARLARAAHAHVAAQFNLRAESERLGRLFELSLVSDAQRSRPGSP